MAMQAPIFKCVDFPISFKSIKSFQYTLQAGFPLNIFKRAPEKRYAMTSKIIEFRKLSTFWICTNFERFRSEWKPRLNSKMQI